MLNVPRFVFWAGGHGIGTVFHTNPNVLHYRNNESNGIMKPGHTFTIEPMICEGTGEGKAYNLYMAYVRTSLCWVVPRVMLVEKLFPGS